MITKFHKNENDLESYVMYKYIKMFQDDEEFNDWCLSIDDEADDMGNIDWDNIIGYDLPNEFDLATYDEEIMNVISTVLQDINLNDPRYKYLRNGNISLEEWQEVNRYNI